MEGGVGRGRSGGAGVGGVLVGVWWKDGFVIRLFMNACINIYMGVYYVLVPLGTEWRTENMRHVSTLPLPANNFIYFLDPGIGAGELN